MTHLQQEGIFRQSGNKKKVEEYIEKITYCKIDKFKKDEDPHIISSILKMYLQQLPEPILTKKIGNEIVSLFSLFLFFILIFYI